MSYIADATNSCSDSPEKNLNNNNDEKSGVTVLKISKRESSLNTIPIAADNSQEATFRDLNGDSVGSLLMPIKSNSSSGSDLELMKDMYPSGFVELPYDSPQRTENWTTRKRLRYTIIYLFTTFSAQLGASMLSATTGQISEQFHVGEEVAVLSFSIYVVGNTLGPVVFAPVSEIFGRKLSAFIPCFICGAIICIAANVDNIAALVVLRFVAGMFGSAPVVCSGGAIADIWKPPLRAAAMIIYAFFIIMGAVTSPVFGALLNTTGDYGWRWALWVPGLLCITLAVINIPTLSETYLPLIEQKYTQRLKLQTGLWNLHSEMDSWMFTFKEFVMVHLARPISILKVPVIFLFVLYTSFVYGLVFLILTTVSKEFQKWHNFTHVTGYIPLFALLFGFLIGSGINVWQSKRFDRLALKLGRSPDSEETLIPMMYFGWCVPCGMFLYGWTMKSWIHWIVPCIGLVFLGIGMAVVFQGCLIYMVDVYPKYAASAIAANTMVRSSFGGIFPLFANQMFDKLGIHWAASVIAFVGLALYPVSWLFYFYGAKLRNNNQNQSKLI